LREQANFTSGTFMGSRSGSIDRRNDVYVNTRKFKKIEILLWAIGVIAGNYEKTIITEALWASC